MGGGLTRVPELSRGGSRVRSRAPAGGADRRKRPRSRGQGRRAPQRSSDQRPGGGIRETKADLIPRACAWRAGARRASRDCRAAGVERTFRLGGQGTVTVGGWQGNRSVADQVPLRGDRRRGPALARLPARDWPARAGNPGAVQVFPGASTRRKTGALAGGRLTEIGRGPCPAGNGRNFSGGNEQGSRAPAPATPRHAGTRGPAAGLARGRAAAAGQTPGAAGGDPAVYCRSGHPTALRQIARPMAGGKGARSGGAADLRVPGRPGLNMGRRAAPAATGSTGNEQLLGIFPGQACKARWGREPRHHRSPAAGRLRDARAGTGPGLARPARSRFVAGTVRRGYGPTAGTRPPDPVPDGLIPARTRVPPDPLYLIPAGKKKKRPAHGRGPARCPRPMLGRPALQETLNGLAWPAPGIGSGEAFGP